jgi:hypothetical protein
MITTSGVLEAQEDIRKDLGLAVAELIVALGRSSSMSVRSADGLPGDRYGPRKTLIRTLWWSFSSVTTNAHYIGGLPIQTLGFDRALRS